MKYLAVSEHFKKQFGKLSPPDQAKTRQSLKLFLEALKAGKVSHGFGFKKINGDKYELRVNIRLRIAMKLDRDTLVCHLVGNHEEIRKYLKDFRDR